MQKRSEAHSCRRRKRTRSEKRTSVSSHAHSVTPPACSCLHQTKRSRAAPPTPGPNKKAASHADARRFTHKNKTHRKNASSLQRCCLHLSRYASHMTFPWTDRHEWVIPLVVTSTTPLPSPDPAAPPTPECASHLEFDPDDSAAEAAAPRLANGQPPPAPPPFGSVSIGGWPGGRSAAEALPASSASAWRATRGTDPWRRKRRANKGERVWLLQSPAVFAAQLVFFGFSYWGEGTTQRADRTKLHHAGSPFSGVALFISNTPPALTRNAEKNSNRNTINSVPAGRKPANRKRGKEKNLDANNRPKRGTVKAPPVSTPHPPPQRAHACAVPEARAPASSTLTSTVGEALQPDASSAW